MKSLFFRFAGAIALCAVVGLLVTASMSKVWAHGDVIPQAVDITGLKPLGEEWLMENPYRGNETAIKIGSSAYHQNCARCHGLEVISGGISPDLRFLETGKEGDEWYIQRVRKGFRQNGATKMPAFEGIMQQEAMWAIRAFIETKSED